MEHAGMFLETSEYAGHHYGTRYEDAVRAASLSSCVKAMDMDGALKMKQFLGDRCCIVYVRRDRKKLLQSLLDRKVSTEEKVRRILSLDVEERGADYADHVLENNGTIEEAADKLKKLVS